MRWWIVCLVVFGVVVAADPAWSQQEKGRPCLERLQMAVPQGRYVTVTTADSQVIKGRLLTLDLMASSLTLANLTATGIEQTTFSHDDILSIKYKKRGRIRPLLCLGGLVAGTILGNFAENYVIDPGYNYDLFKGGYRRGWFWGGLGCLAAGTAVSLLIPSDRTILCR